MIGRWLPQFPSVTSSWLHPELGWGQGSRLPHCCCLSFPTCTAVMFNRDGTGRATSAGDTRDTLGPSRVLSLHHHRPGPCPALGSAPTASPLRLSRAGTTGSGFGSSRTRVLEPRSTAVPTLCLSVPRDGAPGPWLPLGHRSGEGAAGAQGEVPAPMAECDPH